MALPLAELSSNFDLAGEMTDTPMSRTHQYRKVMKPLLERKRRARMNKCFEELKELLVDTLHTEGESISKLEKADVLELTVKHLRKLKRQQQLVLVTPGPDGYSAGYTACASEVTRCLATLPGPGRLTVRCPVPRRLPGPDTDLGYNSSSGSEGAPSPPQSAEPVWRPF